MENAPLPPNEINSLVEGLNRLARNLWGTWDQDTIEIFHQLSPRAWQNLYHNPVAVLHEVSVQELRVRLQDHQFAAKARRTIARFDEYLKGAGTGAARMPPNWRRIPWRISPRSSAFTRRCPSRPAASACWRAIT